MAKQTKTREEILTGRKTRDNKELQAASVHLLYELTMLEHCGLHLEESPPEGMEDYAVLMESFLIHARNLNYFFYGLDMNAKNRFVNLATKDKLSPELPRGLYACD